MKRQVFAAIVVLLGFIVFSGCGGSGSINTNGGGGSGSGGTGVPALFTENVEQGHPTPDPDLGYIRYRFVDVADSLLTDVTVTRFILNIFPDVSCTAIRDSFEQDADGTFIWTGHIYGVNESEVELANDGGSVTGVMRVGTVSYELGYENGWQIVAELDPNLPESTDDAIGVEATAADVPLARLSNDDGSVIDVMVVYTRAARDEVASNEEPGDKGITARIDLAAKETNQGYINSGVKTKVNIVYTGEVTWDESLYTPSETLKDLKNGDIGSVHSLRDTYKADLVVMLALYPREGVAKESLGVGYMMTDKSLVPGAASFQAWGYSVVGVNYATGYYTFAHEMGHNMGLGHYYEVSTQTAAMPEGYAWKTAEFRTIMGPPAGVSRINYWSNPAVYYNGLATGGSGTYQGETYGGNEAKVLNVTRAIVAKFR